MEQEGLKIRSKPILVTEEILYKEYLKHFCNLLPKERKLTETEIDILTSFWDFQGNGMEYMRFTPQIKKLIRDKFGFKKHANLENYLKNLKDKQFLVKDENGITKLAKAIDLKKPLKGLEITYEYKLRQDS